MRSIYENSIDVLSRSSKPTRTSSTEGNKENHNQPDQQNGNLQIKAQAIGDKSLNTTMTQQNLRSASAAIPELIESIERLEDFVQISMKGLYLKEAQEAKDKATELKKELFVRRKQHLEERYKQEYEDLMEGQVKEMSDFNEFWDQRITEFEMEATGIEGEMLERHKTEMVRVEEELRKMIPMKKKTSTQHLNYRKTFETLIKQKEFAEAEHIKGLCDGLEREEQVKAYYEKEQRVKFLMGQLIQRHKNELNVLRKRITTGREELLKAKVIDLEKLLQKFQNKKHQLELDQQIELSRFEILQKNYMPSEANSTRTSVKGGLSRSSVRHSKGALRVRDSSKMQNSNSSMLSPSNIFAANSSMLSPSNAFAEQSPFTIVSPSIKIGKHKRSYTNMGKFNIVDVTGMAETPSEYKGKRANSVVKQ